MLEERDCKGGEKVDGRKEVSGGETDSGRICVALEENRGSNSNKAGRKKGATRSDLEENRR